MSFIFNLLGILIFATAFFVLGVWTAVWVLSELSQDEYKTIMAKIDRLRQMKNN